MRAVKAARFKRRAIKINNTACPRPSIGAAFQGDSLKKLVDIGSPGIELIKL
jgi:hypothetical protein